MPEEIAAAITALARAVPEDGGVAAIAQGTLPAACVRGRDHPPGGHLPDGSGEIFDMARWSTEDRELARLFEDVFPPDTIRNIILRRRRKDVVTLRLDHEVGEAFKAVGADCAFLH